jgi:hypothetical protein
MSLLPKSRWAKVAALLGLLGGTNCVTVRLPQ